MNLHDGFRLGPVRLTLYGLCASVGVVGAMALSGRAARRVGLATEAVWDAGLFAVVCCFVASRLLLVVGDPKAFVHYPLLVLSLPSLTFGGMGLAAVLTWVYLRLKRLPLLRMLDAFAPCGAVLAAFLEAGHVLDRSEPGMPVFGASGEIARVRPVSLYGVAVSVVLAVVLWLALTRSARAGLVAALGLIAGGVAAFGLDMVSLPSELFSGMWLEPGQVVALVAMLAGAVLWTFAPREQQLVTQRREAVDATEMG